VKRHTFVVHVHPDGISTLENLSTQERVRLGDLNEIGPQLERWLADQPDARRRPQADSERVRSGSAPE
jgi:hypothetical protein